MRWALRLIGRYLILLGNVTVAIDDSQSDAWVSEQIDRFVAAAHAAYQDNKAFPAYQKVLAQIVKGVEQRRASQGENFVTRSRQFVDYIEAASLDLKPDHKLGFNVPDQQYFQETKQYVGIPGFLLDQQFLKWSNREETLGKAKAFLAALNSTRSASEQLIFFSYRSRHLGTPDNNNSFRRLLIVVPGDIDRRVPEKWVQFGVTDPGEKVLIRNVSVVAALQKPDGTFDSYFKDYYRTYRSGSPTGIKGRWELGYGEDNCAQCHKTGVLPIFPVDGSVIATEETAVKQLNQRFLTYGAPRFGKYLDERKFGPGLAAAEPVERTLRFGSTFADTAVANSMVCARCHQHQELGALNWPMSHKVIESFVTGGPMPPLHNLSEQDRVELHAKLIDEYFATDTANPGILKSWLLGSRSNRKLPMVRQPSVANN